MLPLGKVLLKNAIIKSKKANSLDIRKEFIGKKVKYRKNNGKQHSYVQNSDKIKQCSPTKLVTDFMLARDVAFSACSEDITKKTFREREREKKFGRLFKC